MSERKEGFSEFLLEIRERAVEVVLRVPTYLEELRSDLGILWSKTPTNVVISGALVVAGDAIMIAGLGRRPLSTLVGAGLAMIGMAHFGVFRQRISKP